MKEDIIKIEKCILSATNRDQLITCSKMIGLFLIKYENNTHYCWYLTGMLDTKSNELTNEFLTKLPLY
jgi:hypothetical protein